MSFSFPPNPVDGQVATQTQPDGTALKATYVQSKNEWVVERVAPKDPTLTLTAGTAYTVAPGKDGQVLTFDRATNQWIGKTPADPGGKGQTFTKGTQAATDTPNPPDPTKPTEMLQPGALQTTLENLHHELKAWNGTAWANVFTEDEIKQWISAGSLFRGVVEEATLNTLPTPAVANRGFYWSWTGNLGHTVSGTDAKISPDLDGEVLQVGDWIQSDGAKWVHVPGDLLSKQRWDSLGSFAPWADTSWESGSVVSYQKSFFRASALVSKGDLAPGAAPANPGEVQKWIDITPLPQMSTGDLSNVNANTIDGGRTHGAVFQWDDIIGEWVSSDTLEVNEVEVNTVRLGTGGGEIYYFEEVDITSVDPADDGNTAASVYAIKEYVKNQPKPFLEELDDCKELGSAADGDVPVWNDANSRWEPAALASPIIYLGTGAFTVANVASKTDNYGMPAGTVPDPQTWAPMPGDQFIDLRTGNVTVFTGTTTSPAPPPRTDGSPSRPSIGAASPVDLVPSTIGALSDVTLNAPADKQILQYDQATTQWKNVTPDYLNPTNGYTKTEVDNKITTVVTGLEHFESVLSRVDTPPASPAANDFYIVGATPTGLWAGQANNLARWDGAAWQFEAPKTNESHLVEDVAETWHWNGADWVKVATATTTGGPAAAGELWMVGAIQQSLLTEIEFKSLLAVSEQAKWALADGRDVSGSKYATTTGRSKVPDLRGAFLRMAGDNNINASWTGGSLNSFGEDTTRRPRTTDFTTNADGQHAHGVNFVRFTRYNSGGGSQGVTQLGSDPTAASWGGSNASSDTVDNGNHSHTINGGGDTETAPKHYSVNCFIKIN